MGFSPIAPSALSSTMGNSIRPCVTHHEAASHQWEAKWGQEKTINDTQVRKLGKKWNGGQKCCKCICRWQKTDKNGSHFDSTELNYVVTVSISMTFTCVGINVNDNDDDNTSNGGRVCGYHSIKQIIFGFASKGLSKHWQTDVRSRT